MTHFFGGNEHLLSPCFSCFISLQRTACLGCSRNVNIVKTSSTDFLRQGLAKFKLSMARDTVKSMVFFRLFLILFFNIAKL